MAAYAALTSLSEATDLLHQQIITLQSSSSSTGERQLENTIESLRENTHFLRAHLEKSPASQFEAEIKDAADGAQGLVVRFVYEHLLSKSLTDDDLKLKSLCHHMEGILEDAFSSLVGRVSQSVRENVSEEEYPVGIFDSFASRLTPLTRDEVIVGLDDETDMLMDLVLKRPSPELGVSPILGTGGMGKTTLARKLYNHTATFQLFQIRGWVTVSRDFSLKDILISLAASIQPYVRFPKQRTESIENHVRKNLKGRRFLIVLDDVWSPEALDFLVRSALPDDGNGSRVLLTTRQRVVAYGAHPAKSMNSCLKRKMSRGESYSLLVRKVFERGHCPPKFETFSHRIATACGGLPLTVVLAAGILVAIDKSFPEWKHICKKITSANDFESESGMVDFILSLSYRHLPHRLRSCFLYLGAFPEDHEINVSTLSKQLLAQDFLRNSTTSEAEDCVQGLVRRNLVSVLKWKYDNRVKRICMHDMVRDFCLKKAQEEKFLYCITDDDSIDRYLARREIKLMLISDNNPKRSFISEYANEPHTIIWFGRGRTRNPLKSIGRFRLLKSLHLVNVEIESFPTQVLELFLLRLLALSHVPELPPSISNLQYLETLMINPRDAASFGGSALTLLTENSLPRYLCLPSEIWTLQRLRHIMSFCCGPLPSSKPENLPLQNLETLTAVMNLDCSNQLMEKIPNVKKLGIFYFGVEPSTHSIENIKQLRNLERLKLWVLVPFSSPQNLVLGFPASLRKLTLRGIRLSYRDMHVVGQLPFLEVLKLRRNDFENDQWELTSSDGFKNLKHILLEELLGLRRWFSSEEHQVLPMLQTLVIRTCNELDGIPTFVVDIPSLELIEVVGSKNEKLVESARNIEEQFSAHPNKVEVRVKKYG